MAASDEFLDDFFSECDEHLIAARQAILELDRSSGAVTPNSEPIEMLFRSFHSIKGLSAMVGLQPTEELAHSLEGYLSAVQKRIATLDADGLDVLIDGIRTIEEILAARQAEDPLPDIQSLNDRVRALVGVASDATSDSPPDVAIDSPQHWRFTFRPTAEVAARGVNVNAVRNRLQSLGTIISAEPQVLHGGQIVFHFLVQTAVPPDPLADWEADSIKFEPGEISSESPAVRDAAASAPQREHRATTSHVVRVDLPRLNDLMRMVGDLVITRARLEEQLERLRSTNSESALRSLTETNAAFERQIRDLRGGVTRMRLVPLREVFGRVQFIVQDLTREETKKVRLEIDGADTEVDKLVVERILDPLLHLVRNAISHGLESRAERLALGKPEIGHLRVAASLHGEIVQIIVEDDGRGISFDQVQAKARASGVIGPDGVVDEASLLDVICSPGLSTREEADRASGRGMGMSAVAVAIEQLSGTLEVRSVEGRGTRFTIRLPLSLSIADAFVVDVAGQRFVVPQAVVREVIDVDSVVAVEHHEVLTNRGSVLPVIRLAALFGLSSGALQASKGLIVGEGTSAVVLTVDRMLGLREIVVRPLIDPLLRVVGINGATELGDGRLVLIIDPLDAIRATRAAAINGQRARERSKDL